MPALVAGTLMCAPDAFAADTPPMTVTLQQASGSTGNYFEVTGRPGATANAGSVSLRNETDKQITVLLDPVKGLTASTLGSAYDLRGSKAGGSAKWIVIGERRVVLAPHASERVSVSVAVPSGAEAGEYLSGIGVQAAGGAEDVEMEGNVAIAQVERYAIGVVTNLPGARDPSIELTGVGLAREPAGVTFTIDARNDGNVILQNVKGSVTISEDGDVVARRPLGPGTFVTDTSIAYPLLIPSLQPEEGTTFEVEAVMRYPGGVARINREVQFGAADARRQQQYGGAEVSGEEDGGSNLLLILLILVVAAACAAALYLWRRGSTPRQPPLREALPGLIAAARASGEPLSVTLVSSGGEAGPHELEEAVRGNLRARDHVFRIDGSGLMVVSPDTTPEAGEMLAAEIRRALARRGNGDVAVIPITSAAQSSSEELLEAAAAVAGDSSFGNGEAGNGGRSEIRPQSGSRDAQSGVAGRR